MTPKEIIKRPTKVSYFKNVVGNYVLIDDYILLHSCAEQLLKERDALKRRLDGAVKCDYMLFGEEAYTMNLTCKNADDLNKLTVWVDNTAILVLPATPEEGKV